MDQDGKESNRGSSANQQGIFSTPELSVDTEKLAQNTKSTSANTRSRVASIFANTDAGQRSQKLDDAMGMSDIQPAQVTEDVVINNGPRKKSKLPIIIAIVALVAVIGGLMGWMIMNNKKEDTPTKQVATLEEARDSFNKYANFLLFEKNSDVLEGEYNPGMLYDLSAHLDDTPESNTYWSTLIEQLQTVLEQYKSAGSPDKYLSSFLENHQQNINFANNYRKLGLMSEEVVLRNYVEHGREKTVSIISERYQPLASSEYSDEKSYYDLLVKYYNELLSLYQIYSDHGCIGDGAISDVCTEGLASDENAQNAESHVNQLLFDLSDTFDTLISTIEGDCWRISTKFNTLVSDDNLENNL